MKINIKLLLITLLMGLPFKLFALSDESIEWYRELYSPTPEWSQNDEPIYILSKQDKILFKQQIQQIQQLATQNSWTRVAELDLSTRYSKIPMDQNSPDSVEIFFFKHLALIKTNDQNIYIQNCFLDDTEEFRADKCVTPVFIDNMLVIDVTASTYFSKRTDGFAPREPRVGRIIFKLYRDKKIRLIDMQFF